jgi:hypothetical protein
MARGYQWVRALQPDEKAIAVACQRLIDETLKPKYLPEIRSKTGWNYPVDLRGRWRVVACVSARPSAPEGARWRK